MLKRTFSQTALIASLCLPLTTSLGCNKQPEVLTADNVPVGTMPDGAEWSGVYYNQTFGFLHVTVSGNSAQGAWENTAGDKWGEMYGELEGDVFRFSWTEYTTGVVGPNAKSEGHGYFKYAIVKEGEPHQLKGEWGLGENALGHSWDCVKQTNMEPDPESVRPTEMEGAVGAMGFDGAKGDADLAADDSEEEEKSEREDDGAPDPL